jgi:aspartyl aminopeptidase
MHKGTVIKWNVNQRYASTAATGFYLHELARINNIPVQVKITFIIYSQIIFIFGLGICCSK